MVEAFLGSNKHRCGEILSIWPGSKTIKVHEKYKPIEDSKLYDIALLKTTKIKFSGE